MVVFNSLVMTCG